MTCAEFKARMERCPNVRELWQLYNGWWHDVVGTMDDLRALQKGFVARELTLTEEGAEEGSRRADCGVAVGIPGVTDKTREAA